MEKIDDSLSFAVKKIELARLDRSEILPGIQSLSVSGGKGDLYLLQLNADAMQNLTEGQILTIRGDPNESAVICTDSKTYELKEAETSNSLWLLPNVVCPEECEKGESRVVPQNICGIFHNYFELRNCKPSFKKLRSVLVTNAFRGIEYEDECAKNYAFEDLLDFIQTSKEELRQALIDLQACELNGYIRILDFDYKFNVLSQIVDVIESRSFPLNKILRNPVIEMVQDVVPKELAEKCFSWFLKETEDVDEGGQIFYAFDEDSVCRIYGEMLLRAAGKFHLDEFLESWQKSVPEGMTCDLVQLRGIALTDRNYSPEVIFHFPCYDMPEIIAERFTKLFKVKEKWSYDEIVPYLKDRAFAQNDVKSLLIKYTRESTKDGVKMYSSKW